MKACAMERGYAIYAECADFQNLKECRKLYIMLFHDSLVLSSTQIALEI